MMLKNPDLAPIALTCLASMLRWHRIAAAAKLCLSRKQAADFMKKFELTQATPNVSLVVAVNARAPTQAGTQLRRCREVLERNVKTVPSTFLFAALLCSH